MKPWKGERRITIVTACINAIGSPELVLNHVKARLDQVQIGIHYYLAEADLLEAGYQDPFVHFDQFEAPAFLMMAAKRHLGVLKRPAQQTVTAEGN